jgi:hypothetical protein
MSEPRVAALVCEGQTDVPILRAALHEVWPELERVLCLQPELDQMERAKGPAGWTQVKAWCVAHAGSLDEVLEPDVGDRIDLLVIVMDVDVAVDAGIADPPVDVGVYETTRLRDTIAGWLRTELHRNLPPAVVLSTPVRAIEAWIIAALFPREKAPQRIEDPAAWLARKAKLRKSDRDGKPWKELHRYTAFATAVAGRLQHVRQTCSEAHRTLRLVEQRRHQLESQP